ncbi:MAG: dockerin type I domain-containing protein [Chthoniobacterales bacterium]
MSDGTNSVAISAAFLLGDSNLDRFVNSGDALQTRSRSGAPTDAGNFTSDVNTDGTVNSGDVTIVRGQAGATLP